VTVPSSTERLVDTNGVRLRVTEAGDRGAPVVILAHGFPELAYSWRHQIPVLAEAGYHVLAPDQRGYGGSSRPQAIEAYNVHELTADLVGLLDDIGAERAVWIGHDWGAIVVWNAPLLHPDRVAAVAALSVPPVPRAKAPPTQAFRKTFGENFFYMLYFQEPGVADADLGRDPRDTLRRFMSAISADGAADAFRPLPRHGTRLADWLPDPGVLPEWLTESDLDYYTREFTRTGFTGGLNWYRNMRRNWELTEHLSRTKVVAPALFIAGELDPVVTMASPSGMEEWVPDLRGKVMLPGTGHWTQQERPAEVNEALVDFLSGLD